MDWTRLNQWSNDLAYATDRRCALAAAGMALLVTLGAVDATSARKKKKSKIKKIACREQKKMHYPSCIAGSTALCEEKATYENWDLSDCLARYVLCCEHLKKCDNSEQAAECQYQYALSISH